MTYINNVTAGERKMYTVTKTFLEGALKGLTVTEQTSVQFEAGKVYGGGWTGSRYVVNSCVREG